MLKTTSKVSRFKYKLKREFVGSKESLKNKLRVSKRRVKNVLSTRNCTLFVQGFFIGLVGISLIHRLIEIFKAQPALAEDLPPRNIAKGSKSSKRWTRYKYLDTDLGPKIVRDANFHLSYPITGRTRSSIAASIVSITTTNSALYLGITSGLIVAVVVYQFQKKYLIWRFTRMKK